MAAGAGARPTPRWLKALAEPLSAAQLRRLEEHRYSAAGVSLLEPPLQLCWTWLLQWVPLWMAPNSITLLGLAVNLLTTLVLISYCPTATEEVGSARGPRLGGGGGTPNCCPGSLHPPPGLCPPVRRAPAAGGAPGEPGTPARLTSQARRGRIRPLPLRPLCRASTPVPCPSWVIPGRRRGCQGHCPSLISTPDTPRAAEGLSGTLRARDSPPHPAPSCGTAQPRLLSTLGTEHPHLLPGTRAFVVELAKPEVPFGHFIYNRLFLKGCASDPEITGSACQR